MRIMSHAQRALTSGLVILSATLGSPDDLKQDTEWSKVRSKGHSVVFGRFEGQFEGPSFRSRKLVFRRQGDSKTYSIEVEPGLGHFEAVLPTGLYELVRFEALYVPAIRPLDSSRYRPLRQRFHVRAEASKGIGPYFYLPENRPAYVGTVVAQSTRDGLIYRGHQLKVVDEFDEALERLKGAFPALAKELATQGITPARHYLLKPRAIDPPLEFANVDDPLEQARDYIAEGKFQQAVDWLATLLPTNDRERIESQLLVGEALLADGKYIDAIELLGAVLLSDPENMRALRLLARAHVFNRDFDSAFSLYQGLSQSLPEDVEARLYLGYMHALRSEEEQSVENFDSAFAQDNDYLLHDVWPFATALRAVESGDAKYEPPELIGRPPRPPRSLRSRRAVEQMGYLAVLIDHQGKVVAAQLSPENSGTAPDFMMAMIHATFRPAALNGVPIPSLVRLGADRSLRTTVQ